jgi:hypothetical protein
MMKSKTFPESELICSFLGYTMAGFFLVYTPLWAIAFATAFVLSEAAGTWAKLVPFVWVGAWVGLLPLAWAGVIGLVTVLGAKTAGAVAGAMAAGAVAWFVLWAVARHVAFAWPRGRLGASIRVVMFAVTGAVTWFVFGATAGRVAVSLTKGDVMNVVMVVAWAWAWAWGWFVCEAVAGVVVGGLAWVAAGVAFAILTGSAGWAWALTGAIAGMLSAVVSKARKELIQSLSTWNAFLIMAATTLLGLGFGRLLNAVFL